MQVLFQKNIIFLHIFSCAAETNAKGDDYMRNKRTDLALEARELWQESAEKETELRGVEAGTKREKGFEVTTVKILNEEGASVLCKPIGTYITVELGSLIRREEAAFQNGAELLAEVVSDMLGDIGEGSVLVVGLGNRAITPDIIGPQAVKNTMVTRHLISQMPEDFAGFRDVSAVETGVTGTTGIESAELVRAVCEKVKPAAVIAVDALASRSTERVCSTVQIADSGIVPGSGVGNSRAALNRETLGVPVIAVGVPTVVDAATLALDIAERAGSSNISEDEYRNLGGEMIVTPREIDTRAADIAKLIGYGINLALHRGLGIEDVDMFLS